MVTEAGENVVLSSVTSALLPPALAALVVVLLAVLLAVVVGAPDRLQAATSTSRKLKTIKMPIFFCMLFISSCV
jgi:uncharacterized protein YybS (DUF2232 family)